MTYTVQPFQRAGKTSQPERLPAGWLGPGWGCQPPSCLGVPLLLLLSYLLTDPKVGEPRGARVVPQPPMPAAAAAVTLELSGSAALRGGLGTLEPALLRSVRRQLLGRPMVAGGRHAATVLGHSCELTVVSACPDAAPAMGLDTSLDLAGGGGAGDEGQASWHREATAAPLSAAAAAACRMAWATEISELSEMLSIAVAVRGAASLPLGVSRGVLLASAAGGGKTSLLRYFVAAQARGPELELGQPATVAAADARAARLARLGRSAQPLPSCPRVLPFSARKRPVFLAACDCSLNGCDCVPPGD